MSAYETAPVFLRDSTGTIYNTSYILSISCPDNFQIDVHMAQNEKLEFEAVRKPHDGEDRSAQLVAAIAESSRLGGGILYWTGKTFEIH